VHQAEKLSERGEFARALEMNQKALFLNFYNPPGDRALYNMGLIYANPAYPDKDYEKSYGSLKLLTDRFPDSPYARKAKAWVDLLEAARRVNDLEKQLAAQTEHIRILVTTRKRASVQAMNRLEEMRRCQDFIAKANFAAALEASRKIVANTGDPRRNEALFNMGLIYAHYANPDKDYKRSQAYFNRLIAEYPGSELAEQAKVWVQLLQMIEKAKQVDIEIEEKKKELTK